MRRRHRIVLTVVIVVASIVVVEGLVLLGTASTGPIVNTLESLGRLVSRTEARAVSAVRGPGRARSLDWLARTRESADSLRRPAHFLLGAYDEQLASLDGVLQLERELATPLPIIQLYTAWGDRSDQRFPGRMTRAIADLGSIPLITWEPWLTDFENRLHPQLPLRDERARGGLAAIGRGDYDFYLDEWAREAAEFGKPIFVRLAHEMNDPYRYPWGPQNNEVWEFIEAWRHVVERFRAAGARNVLWVWSPHLAYDGWQYYYPGDDYVDWVATGVLNYGTVANWSRWWSFNDIFGRQYPAVAALGKPIMIAEFGTLAVGGDRPAWYRAALDSMATSFPNVRALLFFHVRDDRTVTYQALDWSFVNDTSSLRAIRSALSNACCERAQWK